MSKFKLNPLSIALLGAIATPSFAETTTENQNHQLSTIRNYIHIYTNLQVPFPDS